jgi:hypothetical protein
MDTTLIKRKEAAGLICVSLDIHLWSGRKRLRKEALMAKHPEFANLPPETLATLGSIKIADPSDLAPFSRLKREGEKLLLANGLPLLGTTGIPEPKLERVYKRLTGLQVDFDAERAKLYRNYETRVQEWRDKPENVAWAHLISEIPQPEYVAGRLAFGFHMCRVSAPSALDANPVNEHFGRQVGGLKGELFADAAREATILIDRYLAPKDQHGVSKGREEITQKTLRPLKRIAEKLRSFSFLDPSVGPLADVVDHCLGLLPSEGKIDGTHLVHIWALSRTLASPTVAEEAAAIALQLGSPQNAFEQVLAKSKVTPMDTVSAPVQPAAQVVTAGALSPAPALAGKGDTEDAVAAGSVPPAAVPAGFAPQLTGIMF